MSSAKQNGRCSPRPPSERDRAGFLPGLVLLAVTALAMLLLSLRPPGSEQVGVLFPPWATFEEVAVAVGEAGGRLIRAGSFDNLVVAHAASPQFAEKIAEAGAWAVFDPLVLGGCLFPEDQDSTKTR